MTDIFREVEEEVRREQFEKLWRKYRDYILAAAALAMIGVAGYQLYRVYEQRQEEKASIAYAAATEMLDRGQAAAAAPQLAAIVKAAPGGYAAVAKLAEADALYSAGQKEDALRAYQQIANGNDPYLGAAARLHAAWAIADSAPRADIEGLLAPLLDRSNAWHLLAHEIMAYEDLRSGNKTEALHTYRELAADPDAPGALKSRADAMARFIGAGGDANYGTVPEPKPGDVSVPAKPRGGAPVR